MKHDCAYFRSLPVYTFIELHSLAGNCLISNSLNETVMATFQSKVEALLKQLHRWKGRDISLRWNVLIVKALATVSC